jgi:TPR repeat protein
MKKHLNIFICLFISFSFFANAATLQKAAQQGDSKAQFKLGLIYFIGEGVIQNFKLATVWVNLSEYNGYHNARKVKNILLMRTA